MEASTKVLVQNTTGHELFVSLPDIKFKRTWAPYAEYKIPFEVLQEGMFDHGFTVFIEKGILVIMDKAARVELGLESEDGDAEPEVKIYNRGQLTKILKLDTFEEFTEKAHSMTREQCESLIDIALEQGNIDMQKAAVLKEITGIDAVRAIALKAQNEEKEKE